MASQLSILTAVLEGHADALRSAVSALPVGEGSPFAAAPGTHHGRFVVVCPRPLAPATFLMCSATMDVPVSTWIDDFLRALGATADDIWSHCAGWPADSRAAYLLAHRVHPALEFATWDAPAASIVEALDVQRRVVQLALRVQGLDAASQLAAYRAEFSR